MFEIRLCNAVITAALRASIPPFVAGFRGDNLDGDDLLLLLRGCVDPVVRGSDDADEGWMLGLLVFGRFSFFSSSMP